MVVGRFPGEALPLTMAWAVLDLLIARSRDLGHTLPDRHAVRIWSLRDPPATAQRVPYPIDTEEFVPSESFRQIRDATNGRGGRRQRTSVPQTRGAWPN